MKSKTLQAVLVAILLIGGGLATLNIQHRARLELSKNETRMHEQEKQLAELTAEYQRLSDVDEQPQHALAQNQTSELAKLRKEAETLRQQLATNRPVQATRNSLNPDFGHNPEASSPEALVKMAAGRNLGDAYILRTAVWKYAREHGETFPLDLEHATSYISVAYTNQIKSDEVAFRQLNQPQKQRAYPQTSQFEMVYQGSLNELSNVALQSVAMIRERQAWPTSGGKSARLYIMLDGNPRVIESDDNFQSWEAEHVIPPPVVK